MLKEIPISKIIIGNRHRKDLGDLTSLAKSIQRNGLLQPIGVTKKLELVFGERRLRSHQQILKKKTILARIVDVPSIIAGEHDENEIRKDFTPSERVAIAKAIEEKIGKRQGQRTDKKPVENVPQVPNGKKTREVAADRAGFGNDKTYRQAAKVVEDGSPSLIQWMDDGKISISAASILATTPIAQQKAILQLDSKSILRVAKEIRLRQAEERAEHQQSTTVKPVKRNRKNRIDAAQIIHGDCTAELKN